MMSVISAWELVVGRERRRVPDSKSGMMKASKSPVSFEPTNVKYGIATYACFGTSTKMRRIDLKNDARNFVGKTDENHSVNRMGQVV